MSCTIDIRPVPIAPTLIRLPGAFFPNTDAGTIEGKPIAMVVPTTVFTELLRNSLRLTVDCLPPTPEGEFFFFII